MHYQKVSILVSTFIFALLCMTTSVSSAPARRWTYSASTAVKYAEHTVHVNYGTGSNQNPFLNEANNCAHFVSQCIMAGLSGKTKPFDVFAQRYNYTIDRGSSLSWFYISPPNKGSAWAVADNLFKYAKNNRPNYKGLHFNFVASDSPTRRMNYKLIRAGDVVFADFDSDGDMDHTMLVRKYENCLFCASGYNRVRLIYQTTNTADRGMEDINIQYNYRVSFHVYRPVDYNEAGL